VISIRIDEKQIKELKAAVQRSGKKFPIELAVAINATARKTKSESAKELKKLLNVKVSILKKTISTKQKATKEKTRARISFWHGFPIPLKYFGARQLKKGGVTYKINPAFNRPSVIRNAFIVNRYGQNVYRRKGKERGPLQKLHGPSPKEAFEKADIGKFARGVAEKELSKQMDRRIKLNILRAEGLVKK
jgi:hypothetical protein